MYTGGVEAGDTRQMHNETAHHASGSHDTSEVELSARGSHEPKMFPDLDRERERVLHIQRQRVSAGASLTSRPPHEHLQRARTGKIRAKLAALPSSVARTKAATLKPRLLRHLDEEQERVEAARRLGRSAGVLLSSPPPLDLRVRPVSAPPVSRPSH